MKIKFRAYIKPLKRYAKDYETILYHHQCNMEPTWTVNVSPEEVYGDEDLIIEQSTNLYDKDGKEIYEGDIIKRYLFGMENFNGEDCRQYATYEVRWESDECCFALHYLYGYRIGDGLLADNEQENYEIIGNIHKNPELLEKE